MKTKTTRTITTIQLDLEPELEHSGEEPSIEPEFPEALDVSERPSMGRRKEEASKPIYLVRYE